MKLQNTETNMNTIQRNSMVAIVLGLIAVAIAVYHPTHLTIVSAGLAAGAVVVSAYMYHQERTDPAPFD